MLDDARRELAALDGMRGFAACYVVVHHLATNFLLPQYTLLLHGALFVDMFFVISGFVMAYQYGTRIGSTGDVLTFLRRRLARIWPLHAAILAVMLAPRLLAMALHGSTDGALLAPGSDHSLGAWFASLALLNGMGLYGFAVWNGPSWTISVELFAYVIFAVLARSGRGALYPAAAMVLAATAVFLIASGLFLALPGRYSFLRCLYGFFVGVLAYPLFDCVGHNQPRGAAIAAIQALSLMALVALMLVPGTSPLLLLYPPACGALVVTSALAPATALSRVLASRPFQALGLWSLSIYLLHIPLLNGLWRAAPYLTGFGLDFAQASWRWPETAVFLALVIGLAAITYNTIERPARNYLGGRGRRARRAASDVGAGYREGLPG